MSTSVLWSQFGPWIAAGWFAYLALLATWIVLQKREPIATLSWVLSLALLPVVGFLIYHFLGPTRIERQRVLRTRQVILRQARDALEERRADGVVEIFRRQRFRLVAEAATHVVGERLVERERVDVDVGAIPHGSVAVREADARELPARIGREEVAVRVTNV